MKHSLYIVAVLAFAGLSLAVEKDPAVKWAKHLQATLSPSASEFKCSVEAEVHCSIKNTGKSAVTIDTFSLQSNILALEVLDSRGKQIPTIPPPMPPRPSEETNYLKVLEPGNKYKVTYSLHMFSPNLIPGIYNVRMRWISSNTVTVKIRE